MSIIGLIIFLSTFYFVQLIETKIKIKEEFKIYIKNLNKLKYLKANKLPLEEIFDNISSSGTKLIIKIFIFIIPYITNLVIFKFSGLAYIFSTLLASIPYLYFLFKL